MGVVSVSMSWFSSFLDIQEPVRYKVKVRKKPTSNECLVISSATSNGMESQSAPAFSTVPEEINHPEENQKFANIEEELAYYKSLAERQASEIEELRKLPALQKEVYDKLLQAEKIEQEQSEKNAAILLKQRDAAQLMFSNSENALAALNEQLTKERSILQAEMRAVREGFSS